VCPVDHIQRNLLWYGFYEKESILTWEKFIHEDSMVIDIGANIGYYTLVAARKATRGKIHSFEPTPTSFRALEQNVLLNKLPNVIANPAGISNVNSNEKYYIASPDNSGMSGLMPSENFSGQIEIVEIITLDHYSQKHDLQKIDFIKIDIEGNELKALQGMQQVLTRFKPIIFIELLEEHLHKFDSSIKEVYDFFKLNGYEPYLIEEAGRLKRLYDIRESEMMVFIPQGYRIPSTVHSPQSTARTQ